jgi:hypothetical protein
MAPMYEPRGLSDSACYISPTNRKGRRQVVGNAPLATTLLQLMHACASQSASVRRQSPRCRVASTLVCRAFLGSHIALPGERMLDALGTAGRLHTASCGARKGSRHTPDMVPNAGYGMHTRPGCGSFSAGCGEQPVPETASYLGTFRLGVNALHKWVQSAAFWGLVRVGSRT